MNHYTPSIENVCERLIEARNNPSFRKNFPRDLWNDIFSLVKQYSFNTVCEKLNLSPALLSRKIAERSSSQLNFKEVTLSHSEQFSQTDDQVVVEVSKADIKARIEGPVSCLSFLSSIFKER